MGGAVIPATRPERDAYVRLLTELVDARDETRAAEGAVWSDIQAVLRDIEVTADACAETWLCIQDGKLAESCHVLRYEILVLGAPGLERTFLTSVRNGDDGPAVNQELGDRLFRLQWLALIPAASKARAAEDELRDALGLPEDRR
jgi:hypothetical protein